MNKLQYIIVALVCCSTAALAQKPIEVGVKGGATFTHGYTTIPSIPLSTTVSIPELNNESNGIGTGYSFGIWGRKNFDKFFIQVEVDYNSFLLKQQAGLGISAGLAARLAGVTTLPAEAQTLPATLNIVSESTLQSVNIPILFGKRWMGGKLRGYLGPNLLFTTKAEANRTTSGQINTPAQVIPIVPNTTTSDLKNPNPASPTESILKVKSFTYAAEIGVGYTLLDRLDIDARYAVPVGGVYQDNGIEGFLGIGTLTLGYRLF